MNPQIAYLLNLSLQNIQSGRLDEAERLLKQVLKIQPKNPDALCFLSVVSAYRYDFKDALRLIDKSIESAPKNPIAHSNKGNILKELGRYSEAITSYDRAILLDPNYAEALNNRGNLLQDLGDYAEAIASYDRAILLESNYAEAFNNKGNALQKIGLFDEALNFYDRAISINPNYPEPWSHKGMVFRNLKQYENSLFCYKRSLSINPDNAETWCSFGLLYSDCGLHDEALGCYEKALTINSDHAIAWSSKGSALQEKKNYKGALDCYEKAILLNPELEFTRGFQIYTKLITANWVNLENDIDQAINRLSASKKIMAPFYLLSINDSPENSFILAKSWIDDKYPLKNALPPIVKKRHNKIRVGYFSADFKSHPLAFLTAELFELHDRNQFEIYAFALKKAPDGDEMRPRLMKAFDHFLEVENLSDLEVAKLARELEIDIAVDLGGHTQFAPTGIMSYRAAPIQVNYLGYAGTMGAEYMDYIIADRTVIPESSQKYYSEKVVYLPNSFMVDDSKRVASDRVFTRQECGLPENTFVFCCFNNSYKFNKRILESWSRILLKVENSVLWLSENNEHFRNNIKTEFKNFGVDPNRIIFAQRVDSMADHLARYKLADLFLDTHPYNAHTTAIDALKAGVPVITYLGQAFPGRVAASLLNAVGLQQLITRTISEYEITAVNLALNVNELAKIKKLLVKNLAISPIFETSVTTLQLEAIFREISN